MNHQTLGGLVRAATGDMAAMGAKGQTGLLASFLAQIPAHLPDRDARAHLLYRAHMSRLARKGVEARQGNNNVHRVREAADRGDN